MKRPIATRQICQMCWQPGRIGFVVPDEVWASAVHPEFQDKAICVGCFTRLADERLIPWDDRIELWGVSLASMLNETTEAAA